MKIKPYGQIRAMLLLVLILTGLTLWGLLLTEGMFERTSSSPNLLSITSATLLLFPLWSMFVIWIAPYAGGCVVKAPKESRHAMCILSPSGSALQSMHCMPGEQRIIDIADQEVVIHIDGYPHNVYCEDVTFALGLGFSERLRVTARATARIPHDVARTYGLRAAHLQEVLAFSAQNALDTVREQINQDLRERRALDVDTLKKRLRELLKDQPEEAVVSGIDFEWTVA